MTANNYLCLQKLPQIAKHRLMSLRPICKKWSWNISAANWYCTSVLTKQPQLYWRVILAVKNLPQRPRYWVRATAALTVKVTPSQCSFLIKHSDSLVCSNSEMVVRRTRHTPKKIPCPEVLAKQYSTLHQRRQVASAQLRHQDKDLGAEQSKPSNARGKSFLLGINSPISNCCSHGVLLLFSFQNSHWNICYKHELQNSVNQSIASWTCIALLGYAWELVCFSAFNSLCVLLLSPFESNAAVCYCAALACSKSIIANWFDWSACFCRWGKIRNNVCNTS